MVFISLRTISKKNLFRVDLRLLIERILISARSARFHVDIRCNVSRDRERKHDNARSGENSRSRVRACRDIAFFINPRLKTGHYCRREGKREREGGMRSFIEKVYEPLFRPIWASRSLASDKSRLASGKEERYASYTSNFSNNPLTAKVSPSLSLSPSVAPLQLKGCRNLARPARHMRDTKPDDFHNNPLVLCARIRTDDSVSLKAAISSPPPGNWSTSPAARSALRVFQRRRLLGIKVLMFHTRALLRRARERESRVN